jgi:hypothetical protein
LIACGPGDGGRKREKDRETTLHLLSVTEAGITLAIPVFACAFTIPTSVAETRGGVEVVLKEVKGFRIL